jgi:hypothetical protein
MHKGSLVIFLSNYNHKFFISAKFFVVLYSTNWTVGQTNVQLEVSIFQVKLIFKNSFYLLRRTSKISNGTVCLLIDEFLMLQFKVVFVDKRENLLQWFILLALLDTRFTLIQSSVSYRERILK